MQTTKRRHSTALIDELLASPWSFDFFQAVRLLNAYASHSPTGALAVSEHIRFANSVALDFPSAELQSICALEDPIDVERGGTPDFVVTTRFFGLTGALGSLPLHYTERVTEAERLSDDSAIRAFYDMLTSRAVELFYLAWRKHKLALMYEADPDRHFTPLLLAFCGLGQDALRDRMSHAPGGVSDESIAHFAGLIFQRPLSAHAIQRILSAYFNVGVTLKQFHGGWCAASPTQLSKLGSGASVLGSGAFLGERVWQRDLSVQIAIGPLDIDSYRSFLPGSSRSAALGKLLKFLTGCSFAYEIRLVLCADAEKACRLSQTSPVRLGMDSYMTTRENRIERRDAAFSVL